MPKKIGPKTWSADPRSYQFHRRWFGYCSCWMAFGIRSERSFPNNFVYVDSILLHFQRAHIASLQARAFLKRLASRDMLSSTSSLPPALSRLHATRLSHSLSSNSRSQNRHLCPSWSTPFLSPPSSTPDHFF